MIEEVAIDEIDEKIIDMLRADGRCSNRAIGREIELSEGSIRKRIKRLVGSGAMSYGLVVDVDSTGVTISGWLSIEVHPAKAHAVADFISAMEHCVVCCITTGRAAVRAYVYLEDLSALHEMTASISAREGVIDVGFRAVAGHTQHRYEMIMLSESPKNRQLPYQGDL